MAVPGVVMVLVVVEMAMIIVEPIKNFKYWLANLQSPGCEINVEKISFDDKSLKRHARHHVFHMYSEKLTLHLLKLNSKHRVRQNQLLPKNKTICGNLFKKLLCWNRHRFKPSTCSSKSP